MSGSDTEDNQLSDEDAAIEILARLDQLIQRFGDTKGLSESSFDGDNTDGSLCFRFGGRDWLISSNDVQPND